MPAGVVVGESVHGLLVVVAATTTACCWVAQVVLGVVALAVVCAPVMRTSRRTTLTVMTGLLTAVAFVVCSPPRSSF